MKLVVLDANAYWTEQLFRQRPCGMEVLLLKPRDFRFHKKKTGSFFSDRKARFVDHGLFEQRFSMLPGWMFELWPLSTRKLAGAIQRFAGEAPYTLVLTYPQYRSLVPLLKPARSVYYNLDDYRDNWPGRGIHIPQWERELVEMADLTICIAQHRVNSMREKHPTKADSIFHLPLGCTPEFMAGDEYRDSHPVLDALLNLKRPLAGYIGGLNYRFDFELLAEVAVQLPEVTFVLGGKIFQPGDSRWQSGLERVRSMPNVHFIGWVDHASLGQFLHSFDLLLMPYSHCNFNTNACPAKLWDYLGTGKPIVANDSNPETLLWKEVVRIGTTPDSFADEIRDALKGEPPSRRERRLEIAREHTWEKLGKEMERILASQE